MRTTSRRGVKALTVAIAVLLGACTASEHNTSSLPPTPVLTGDAATYAAAVAEIQAYLDMWVKDGPYAAAARYLVPEEQAPACATARWPLTPGDPCGPAPLLLSANVASTDVWSWTSSDDFTLGVTMSLHFGGDPTLTSNWGEGNNERFFRFTRPNAGSDYRMYLATGP
jgi:hypothetical protein